MRCRYNDTGELLPGQGGTNEMIAHKMYTTLSEQGKQRAQFEADQIRAEQEKTDDPNTKKDVAKSSMKDRFNGFKVSFISWLRRNSS